jgi:SAM-dependent methyltransferase
MKISATLILLCCIRLSRGAYQVGKESRAYKHAVEKVTKAKVVEIVPNALESLVSKGFALPDGVAEWKHQGPPLYWYHTKIHSLGNTGLFGALHSALCPIATYIIDAAAYSGENVRQQVSRELRRIVKKPRARIADLCCGVGFSTQALQDSFQDADIVVGVDTSPEMINMARLLTAESPLGKIANWHQKLASDFSQNFRSETMNDSVFPSKFPLYHLSNAESTPFPGRSFDLVTIM